MGFEKAKALFAEAGWTDTDGDGVIDKDGVPFEFTLTTNTGNKRRADVAILVQAHLKEAGVKVNIEKQESNTFFENLRKKDYEAALAGWSAGLFIDPTTIWHSDITCEEPDAALQRRKGFVVPAGALTGLDQIGKRPEILAVRGDGLTRIGPGGLGVL